MSWLVTLLPYLERVDTLPEDAGENEPPPPQRRRVPLGTAGLHDRFHTGRLLQNQSHKIGHCAASSRVGFWTDLKAPAVFSILKCIANGGLGEHGRTCPVHGCRVNDDREMASQPAWL